MRVLLFVLGLLALISGSLKLRERIRTQIGTSQLVIAELAAGALAVLLAALGVLGNGGMAVLTLLVLGAVVVAAVHQSRLVADHQRRRDLSEGRRLQRYLESQDDGAHNPGTEGTE